MHTNYTTIQIAAEKYFRRETAVFSIRCRGATKRAGAAKQECGAYLTKQITCSLFSPLSQPTLIAFRAATSTEYKLLEQVIRT